jgi:signal transduction histidine kinase
MAVQRLKSLTRRYFFDVLVVAGTIEAGLETALRHDAKHAPLTTHWFAVPAVIAIGLPLLTRRRFPFAAPIAVPLIGCALSFVDGRLVTFTFGIFLVVLAAAFLLGMLRDRIQASLGLVIALGAVIVVVHNDPMQHSVDLIGPGILTAIVWLTGFALGSKLSQAADAEERAAQLDREREERAREAVAEERVRIARELHDVVGHSVSVMTVQASAVRRLLKPEQTRELEALLIVEQTGREALAEMRRLVGVLRRPEEAPALAPQPSLQYVDKLAERAREAGLPVDLRIEGEPIQLPASVDLTAYRLVQEGLTNALKHAEATQAEVVVRYAPDQVEISVSDNGRGAGSNGDGGHGLVGMRERVSVYGGELEAGPRPEGGYRLSARLPVTTT